MDFPAAVNIPAVVVLAEESSHVVEFVPAEELPPVVKSPIGEELPSVVASTPPL